MRKSDGFQKCYYTGVYGAIFKEDLPLEEFLMKTNLFKLESLYSPRTLISSTAYFGKKGISDYETKEPIDCIVKRVQDLLISKYPFDYIIESKEMYFPFEYKVILERNLKEEDATPRRRVLIIKDEDLYKYEDLYEDCFRYTREAFGHSIGPYIQGHTKEALFLFSKVFCKKHKKILNELKYWDSDKEHIEFLKRVCRTKYDLI